MKFWIPTIPILLMALGGVRGDTKYVTLSTVKARPLSIGGAFISVRDDLASLDFNPATFQGPELGSGIQVTGFFNPLGLGLVIGNRENVPSHTAILGWIVRGAALSVGRLRFGVLFGEESLSDEDRLERSAVFGGSGYRDSRNTCFGVSLSLARRVKIGMAGELFSRRIEGKTTMEIGYRYGILVETRFRLRVGLCFIDFPKEYPLDRIVLERLADETLNIGASYRPWDFLMLSLDVRNVSDEGKGAVREPHIGLEWIPWRHTALRHGYYWDVDEKLHVLSAGLGIFDWNFLLSERRRYVHSTFVLNAAMIWRFNESCVDRWFLLSSAIRF